MPNHSTAVSQLLHINVLQFRDGLVFKSHRRFKLLKSRLETYSEKERRSANPSLDRSTAVRVGGVRDAKRD